MREGFRDLKIPFSPLPPPPPPPRGFVVIFTARKRSLGQGNIFTPVCHSVQGGGGCLVPGGVPAPGGGGAWWRPIPEATAPGGTHPTGMHSCRISVHLTLKMHSWD